MRLLTFLLIPLALSACVANQAPITGMTPRSAELSRERLAIRMSNGTTCVGGSLTDGTKRWTGQLAGCPEGWRFRVVLSDHTNPTRFIVEEVLTSLTLKDILVPRAEVTVTDPNNNATTFVKP